jgi:Gpi18-like mannosyltransferase
MKKNRLLLAAGVILALALRFSLFPYESRDYKGFLSGWYDFIAEHGFGAFAKDFSNYNPPYLYMMAIVIYLFPFLPKIAAIKIISVVFDLILAWFVYKLVSLKYPESIVAVFSFFAVLFAPTVFLNSACWGQADSIYTAGLAACLYWLCTNKQWHAIIAFSFAFVVKAQAIFFAPLLLVLLFKRRISWKPLLLVPFIYLIALLPSLIAGRNFFELLTIYLHQSSSYHELSKNAPNFFEWFPDSAYSVLYPAGLVLAMTVVLLMIGRHLTNHQAMDRDRIVQSALGFVLIVPYFLPKMHERYFYPADVFSLVYAFYFPKFFYVPVVVIFCSFLAYLPYLFNVQVPLKIISIVLGVMVLIVAHHSMGPQTSSSA